MDSKSKSLEDHRCHICGKLFANLKKHYQKHKHTGNDSLPKPTHKDSLETYRKYYNL